MINHYAFKIQFESELSLGVSIKFLCKTKLIYIDLQVLVLKKKQLAAVYNILKWKKDITYQWTGKVGDAIHISRDWTKL